MRIFDGVETNPKPPPQPSRGEKWLAVVMLVFNAFVSAERCRQERVATESEELGALEQVMAQAGLKIPKLEHALAQLMGNAEEAKVAASVIAGSSDPMDLLQQFFKRFSADAATSGSSPTGESSEPPRAEGASEPPSPLRAAGSSEPPPRGASGESAPSRTGKPPAPAAPAAPVAADAPAAVATSKEPAPTWERSDFDRFAREAARAADAAGEADARPGPGAPREPAPPAGELLWEHPDFDRIAVEAARAADAAGAAGAAPPPPLPKYWPGQARAAANDTGSPPPPQSRSEVVSEAHEDGKAAAAPPPSAPTRPSLVDTVRRQLEALRRRMAAHEAELDTRLAQAEAELAALRDALRQRARPTLVVVSPSSDEVTTPAASEQFGAPALADDAEVEADGERPKEVVEADASRVDPSLAKQPQEVVEADATRVDPSLAGRPQEVVEADASRVDPSLVDPADDERPQEVAEADATRVDPSKRTGSSPEIEGPATPAEAAQRFIEAQQPARLPEGAAPQPSGPAAELPSSATDQDFAEALEIIADLCAEADAHHQRDRDRVDAVVHEARVLRAAVQGETTQPATECARS